LIPKKRLIVDNFLIEKIANDFKAQSPKPVEMLIFIDFCAAFALI